MPRKDESPRRRGRERETKTGGWAALAKRQTEIEEKKEEMSSSVRDFWLASGESAIIQFLEDEPYCYDAHVVKDKNGRWATVPCQLNTSRHCTLCSDGVKQTWKASFMVLDYRGNWDKDKKRFKHDEPQLRIWKVGTTIAQSIKAFLDKKGKDLTECVFEVSRSGKGKDSSYNFEMAVDDDERRMKPVKYTEDYPSAEELCQPPTTDEIDKAGYSADE